MVRRGIGNLMVDDMSMPGTACSNVNSFLDPAQHMCKRHVHQNRGHHLVCVDECTGTQKFSLVPTYECAKTGIPFT